MNSVKSCKNVKDRPKEHYAMYDSDVVGDPDNLFHLLNDVFLVGDEPTVEDLLLILGTLVGFIAFVLWCCFPVTPYLKCAENERNDEKVNKVFKEYQRELVGKKKFDGYQNFCF